MTVCTVHPVVAPSAPKPWSSVTWLAGIPPLLPTPPHWPTKSTFHGALVARRLNSPVPSWKLEREELDLLIQRLSNAEFTSDEDLEDARWLRTYIGKTGFLQLGFAHQGVMMVYEASTPWYERYQGILEMADDFAGLPIDEPDQGDEP